MQNSSSYISVDSFRQTCFPPKSKAIMFYVSTIVYYFVYSLVSPFGFTICVYFLMTATCVLLSVLPLVVLTCVPLSQRINRPCLPFAFVGSSFSVLVLCIIVFSFQLNLIFLSFDLNANPLFFFFPCKNQSGLPLRPAFTHHT